MPNRVTMDIIGKKAGVSKSTVSYVLSGKKKISREIEERVLQVVDELNYHPQLSAPKLVKQELKIISLCIPMESKRLSDDDYYLPLIEGALDRAHKEGYQLIINKIAQDDKISERAFYRSLNTVDGVILANLRKDHIYDNALKQATIPYVVNGTPEKGELDKVFYVDLDLVGVGFQASQYLIKTGHNNIFYINMPKEFIQSRQRLEGFKLAHKEAGIAWKEENICYLNVNIEDSYTKAREVIRKRGNEINGFVVANDIMAMGVVRALQEEKISIPDRVAVIGMGGNMLAGVTHPQLTTIDFSPYRCGYESAGMLIEIITRKRIQPSHTLIPGSLVQRETA